MTATNSNARPVIGAGTSGAATTFLNDNQMLRHKELFWRRIAIAKNKPLPCGCYCDETVCTEHTYLVRRFARECRNQMNHLCRSEHWRWSW